MAKNTNRAASAIAYVAALLLATGAWAAHWEMYVNNPVTYAKEVFGGDDPAAGGVTLGADVDTTTDMDEQTSVDMRLVLPHANNTDFGANDQTVGDESELEVTVTLLGATFGQAVNWTDIRLDDDTDESDMPSNFVKVGGSQVDGRRGDNSVTFKIHVPEDAQDIDYTGTGMGGQTGHFIRIDLGSLNGYAGAGAVTLSVSMRVTDGPQNNFPTTFEAVEEVMAVTADDTAMPPVVGVEYVPGTSGMIANAVTAVTFTGANGGTGNIDLADRAKLAAPATQVAVGSLSNESNEDAVEKDGMTKFAEEGGDGTKYDVHVTVTGMVRDTDTIFYSADAMMDDKESLSITDGVATGTFRLGDGTVYFVPDGETPMSAGDLTASFAVEYDATSVVDPAAVGGGGELVYNGVEMQARAYAIPNQVHPDEGNVRIFCGAQGDGTCTVFLDCNEQNGMARFGELGDTIAAGATEHLTEAEIAEVLGVDDWMGRLSCDVLSSAMTPVSVQVLVRSEGSLINNTYVSSGGN
jgi:hypothetical protein